MNSLESLAYYNSIAAKYDEQMDLDEQHRNIRKKMLAYFSKNVEPGLILDFGGGTGLDLPELSDRYSVFFCEPAQAMRAIAKIRVGKSNLKNIQFMEDHETDFRKWSVSPEAGDPSFNGVLANFAVLNHIPELTLLFSVLANRIEPGGHLICNVLGKEFFNSHKPKLRRWMPFWAFNNSKLQQADSKVLIYQPMQKIQEWTAPWFELVHKESLGGLGFHLVHLRKHVEAH